MIDCSDLAPASSPLLPDLTALPTLNSFPKTLARKGQIAEAVTTLLPILAEQPQAPLAWQALATIVMQDVSARNRDPASAPKQSETLPVMTAVAHGLLQRGRGGHGLEYMTAPFVAFCRMLSTLLDHLQLDADSRQQWVQTCLTSESDGAAAVMPASKLLDTIRSFYQLPAGPHAETPKLVQALLPEAVDPDTLECHLCVNLLYQPVTTSCGHTFCKVGWLDLYAPTSSTPSLILFPLYFLSSL